MIKCIVTTSIYPPSEATLKYAAMEDWQLIVVGDLKTPHDAYREHTNMIYLSPEAQAHAYPQLSEAIGWNKVMRRNIGFIEAYKLGAEVVASVDDDNIPYENWGENVIVGQEWTVPLYTSHSLAFDPLQLTNHPELWHRGYPLELIQTSKVVTYEGGKYIKILFQVDLWDGDPDVDAVCRLQLKPKDLKLELRAPFGQMFSTLEYAPFNSQNTFIAREALPYYMVLPYVGRMDDIWGGYIVQYLLNTRPVFMPPTVKQERNAQSVYKNLEDEVLGYTTTLKLLQDIENWRDYLPKETLLAYHLYIAEYQKLGVV